jgi:hypothetical protein
MREEFVDFDGSNGKLRGILHYPQKHNLRFYLMRLPLPRVR